MGNEFLLTSSKLIPLGKKLQKVAEEESKEINAAYEYLMKKYS